MDPIQTPQPMQAPGTVPAGPMPPGMAPAGAQPQEMASPEEKQQLMEIIAAIKSKMADLTATKLASGNKTDAVRRDLLKQVFTKLQMAGVDLADKNSVAAFLTRIRANSPELADMFENAMNVLLGGAIDQSSTPQNNMNNINPNEAVPQDIQGPITGDQPQ